MSETKGIFKTTGHVKLSPQMGWTKEYKLCLQTSEELHTSGIAWAEKEQMIPHFIVSQKSHKDYSAWAEKKTNNNPWNCYMT